ncbi:hypothetical protein ONE63_005191 [Megalurothrips usitatus]|uniref:Transposable element Tc3 transposase n=1 Tax=Megalurothrips usitatus TaxID=439358 RepID=A0AAV7XV78_9NEOP|nr:hypothetical protein ONE63_005191 [Megalurothrips usitatus]
MDRFTNEELADMHLAYGAAGGSNTRALRLYAQEHPGRAQPDRRLFGKIHSNLRESGARRDPPRARPVRDNVELQVLAQVDDNPHTSTRKIAANVGCSHGTVMHVLKEQLLHPFKLVQVQDLGPDDFPLRLQYCQWMRDRVGEVPRFLGLVASTDEKGFSREGTFNAHNNHYWAEENPHAMHTRGYQRKFRVNVWAGIVGNHLLGPVILPGNLNGPMYLEFLQTTLEDMLEEVLPLDLWRDMWFQQDGCPAHWALAVRAYGRTDYGDCEFSLQLIPDLTQWDQVLLLVSATVAAMASTLLRSFNLVGAVISALILDSQDLTRTLLQLGSGNEFAPNPHSDYPSSGFFLRLRALIERTVGVNIPHGTWATRVWNGRHAGELNPVTALCVRFNHPDEVPNFGNALGVDGLLLLRPIEWGLSAGPITADFTLELAADNVLGVAGLFTHLGTAEYEKRIKEKHAAPWQWLTHSATSLQACCRWLAALIGNRQDVTIHEAHNSLAGPGGFVNVAIRVHIPNAPFTQGTGYLPPLVVRTFTHRDMCVCMPAIQDQMLLPVMAFILKAKSGPQPTFVPLARAPAEQHKQRFAENVPIANYSGKDNYGNAPKGHVSRRDQHVAISSSAKQKPQGNAARPRSKSRGIRSLLVW